MREPDSDDIEFRATGMGCALFAFVWSVLGAVITAAIVIGAAWWAISEVLR